MKQYKRDVSGILKFAKEKNKNTVSHVEWTLKQMIKQKQVISFSHVAKRAEVSRSWLYKNAIIRNEIETTRQQQSKKLLSNTGHQPQEKQNEVVENLKKRIKKLQQEKAKLHKQLEAIYGRMIE